MQNVIFSAKYAFFVDSYIFYFERIVYIPTFASKTNSKGPF